MSERDVDVDALFARNADTRLLDRRRRDELGLPAQPTPSSSTPARFGAESIAEGDPAADATATRPASLRATVEARPAAALIPGTVVTIVVAVHDDGDLPVENASLRIVLPPDAEPVAGSAAREGVALADDRLFGEGVRLGTIAARGATRVRFALRVLPGTASIDVAAHAVAPGTPSVAAPTLRLSRRVGHAAYETPRPFYELEPGESDDDPTLAAAQEPAQPTRLVDAVLDEPIAVPAPIAPASPFALVRTLEIDDVRALERVFAGAIPHGLAALTLLTSIAAVDGPFGDAFGLGVFTRGVAAGLPRALVAARIGKPTGTVVTAQTLATIRADATASPAPFTISRPSLVARFDGRELEGLRAVLARTLADPFLRGAQILLAVIPRAVEGVPAPRTETLVRALAAYRVAGGAWLMRVTVRRAVDHRFDPLVAEDAALHGAGRTLVDALREALA